MNRLEVVANAVATVSIVLAAWNSVHTWGVGIAGCVLFGILFFEQQLYADATLQIFFIITSIIGWRTWAMRAETSPSRASAAQIFWMVAMAIVVTVGYGSLLHHYTDAYAPFVDSAVLGLSVAAQLLLMRRNVETWPFWLAVNTIAVPMFASRGLVLTAILYGAYWVNAWFGWWRWRVAMCVR